MTAFANSWVAWSVPEGQVQPLPMSRTTHREVLELANIILGVELTDDQKVQVFRRITKLADRHGRNLRDELRISPTDWNPLVWAHNNARKAESAH